MLAVGADVIDDRSRGLVAAPSVEHVDLRVERRPHDVVGVDADRVEVVREARTADRREEMIVQGELARVGIVVGDLRLRERSVGAMLAVDVRAAERVEVIHLAAVNRHLRGIVVVSYIWLRHVEPLTKRHALAAFGEAARGAIRARIVRKKVVERAIFLHQEDDVLDRAQPLRRRDR